MPHINSVWRRAGSHASRGLKLAGLLIPVALGACQTVEIAGEAPVVERPATVLTSDGACVSRTVEVYDRDYGVMRPVTQRFCGGAAQVAR